MEKKINKPKQFAPTNNKKLIKAREAAELAFLKIKTAQMNNVMQKYEGAEVNKKRRSATIEVQGEDGILNAQNRLQGIANLRDTERNYPLVKAIIKTLKSNIVGTLGHIQVNSPDGQEATDYFNKIWSKNCSGRDDSNWNEILQNVIAARYTTGDCLLVVDDEWVHDDAKIYAFEADQICSMMQSDFDELYAGKVQENGIVKDALGVELGYFVCKFRGKTIAPKSELTFIPRSDWAKLIKSPCRFNQGRGVADLLPSIPELMDLKSFVKSELQTAKLAAMIAGKVKRTPQTSNFDDIAGNPLGGTVPELPENEELPTYQNFEEACGGVLEYMDAEDDFEILDINRPNINAEIFHKFVLGLITTSLGIAPDYITMTPSTSYTSFRGSSTMSWNACFYPEQKFLERKVCDWIGVKVIKNAIKRGLIKDMQAGWEQTISWSFPVQPAIDEGKEAQAIEIKLRSGQTTYQEVNGPNWKKMMEQQGMEKETASENDLTYLSTYQSANGVPVDSYDTGSDNSVNEDGTDNGSDDEADNQ